MPERKYRHVCTVLWQYLEQHESIAGVGKINLSGPQ